MMSNEVIMQCSLCGEEKSVNLQRSIDYRCILCYDCANRVDEEYVALCEMIIGSAENGFHV